jgi:hypothetical protein
MMTAAIRFAFAVVLVAAVGAVAAEVDVVERGEASTVARLF